MTTRRNPIAIAFLAAAAIAYVGAAFPQTIIGREELEPWHRVLVGFTAVGVVHLAFVREPRIRATIAGLVAALTFVRVAALLRRGLWTASALWLAVAFGVIGLAITYAELRSADKLDPKGPEL